MSSKQNNPMRQLAAAWEAATTVANEWADRTAAITAERVAPAGERMARDWGEVSRGYQEFGSWGVL